MGHTGRFLAGAAEALDRPGKRAALLSFFDYCIAAITVGSPPRAEAAVRTMLDDLETTVHTALTTIDDGVARASMPVPPPVSW